MNPAIKQLIDEFIATLETLIAEGMRTRLDEALGSFQAPDLSKVKVKVVVPLYPRTKAQVGAFNAIAPKKTRRKAPIQLCPSPGCINRAAPVFGMLCKAHKDTSKSLVAIWRKARRARGR